MKNTHQMRQHEFYCTLCGKKGIPVIRTEGELRAKGHLKKLYCLFCKAETNHCEIAFDYTKEDFHTEFTLGRFVNGERVPIGELIMCSKADCLYCIEGRCWNANKSFDCKHRKD